MTRSKLMMTTALFAALTAPAVGAQATFNQVDKNGDRQLSRAELSAAFGRRSADRIISRGDDDGDGILSVQEVRASSDDRESDDDERDDYESDDERDHGESDDGEDDGGESDDGESDGGESDDGESDHGESDDGESDGESGDDGESGEGDDD